MWGAPPPGGRQRTLENSKNKHGNVKKKVWTSGSGWKRLDFYCQNESERGQRVWGEQKTKLVRHRLFKIWLFIRLFWWCSAATESAKRCLFTTPCKLRRHIEPKHQSLMTKPREFFFFFFFFFSWKLNELRSEKKVIEAFGCIYQGNLSSPLSWTNPAMLLTMHS